MIPYEDLVVALQTWRAKRGLPVGQMSGTFVPPPPAAKAAPPPPPRPPMSPPGRVITSMTPPAPPPLADLDLEEHAIDESHYENEGGDFAMAFDAAAAAAMHAQLHGEDAEDESTSIGQPPPRPSDGFGAPTDPNPLAGLADELEAEELPDPAKSIRTHNRNDDW